MSNKLVVWAVVAVVAFVVWTKFGGSIRSKLGI